MIAVTAAPCVVSNADDRHHGDLDLQYVHMCAAVDSNYSSSKILLYLFVLSSLGKEMNEKIMLYPINTCVQQLSTTQYSVSAYQLLSNLSPLSHTLTLHLVFSGRHDYYKLLLCSTCIINNYTNLRPMPMETRSQKVIFQQYLVVLSKNSRKYEYPPTADVGKNIKNV